MGGSKGFASTKNKLGSTGFGTGTNVTPKPDQAAADEAKN